MSGRVRVVVTVGTDHHPFDRLLGWVGELVDAGVVAADEVLVQHGSSVPPVGTVAHERVPREHLRAAMAAADCVVGQGGPGTVLDARENGHLPIVVPRRHDLGEHVDDHQVTFARHLAELGTIRIAEDAAALRAAVSAALADPDAWRVPSAAGLGADRGDVGRRLAEVVAQLDGRSRPSVLQRVRQLRRAHPR